MSPEEIAERRYSLGGSDANLIAGGDNDAIHRLWMEKTEQSAPSDLSSDLAVMMGSWTEELNRYWFERNTGLIVRDEGGKVTHREHRWLTATLDGVTTTPDGEPAIFEAKHVNGLDFDADEVLGTYVPQLHHNMFVADVEHAVLSVFVGTQRWKHFWIGFDPFYHADLFDAEKVFWKSVTSGAPPDPHPGVAMTVAWDVHAVDMTGNNQWASMAAEYVATRDHHTRHLRASKCLREMVPQTAVAASGHGLAVKRDRRGALRITVLDPRTDEGRDVRTNGSAGSG